MSLLDRSDLKYDYIWSPKPGKAPRTSASTQNDSNPNVFRPGEGDQVLTFLNEYAESHNILEKEEARNLEPMIRKRIDKDDGVTKAELEIWLDKQLKKEGSH